MRHKTLFRLLIKFLGVWLTCNGFTSLVSSLSNWIAMTMMRPSSGSYAYPYWISAIGALCTISIGLYLFVGGKWIVDKAIPSNRPYCHECGYDLTGAIGDVCNECGTAFRGTVAATHE